MQPRRYAPVTLRSQRGEDQRGETARLPASKAQAARAGDSRCAREARGLAPRRADLGRAWKLREAATRCTPTGAQGRGCPRGLPLVRAGEFMTAYAPSHLTLTSARKERRAPSPGGEPRPGDPPQNGVLLFYEAGSPETSYTRVHLGKFAENGPCSTVERVTLRGPRGSRATPGGPCRTRRPAPSPGCS
jgi:hypothetical protein